MNKNKLIEELFSEIVGGYTHDPSNTGGVESIYGSTDATKFRPKEEEGCDDEELYESLFSEFELDEAQRKREVKKAPVLTEDESGDSVTIPLPKFTPNESWGDPNSADFKRIEKFVLKAAGAEKDIKKKFDKLLRPFESEAAVRSPGRMISSLILLESLASILRNFSESPAGFVFEGFLAALTFGKQINEKTPTGLPIEDIVAYDKDGLNGVPASLKVLRGRARATDTGNIKHSGTGIHGSYQNLIRFFDRYSAIEYVVALKRGKESDQVQLFSFFLTRGNMVEVFFKTGNQHLFGDYAEELQEDPRMSWQKLRKILYATIGEEGAKWKNKKDSKTVKGRSDNELGKGKYDDKGSQPSDRDAFLDDEFYDDGTVKEEEKSILEAKSETQWEIKQHDLPSLRGVYEVGAQEIARLDLSTDGIRKRNAFIADKLGDTVRKLFVDVKSMSTNIDDYFTSPDRDTAKSSFGPDAATNADEIGKEMSDIVTSEGDKETEEPA